MGSLIHGSGPTQIENFIVYSSINLGVFFKVDKIVNKIDLSVRRTDCRERIKLRGSIELS